jgi:5'-3' exonuclease
MTLMLLDSASLWYRAFFGMPDTLVAPDGMQVNAIRGFLDATARLMTQYQPTRLVACIEGDWRPSWRVELFPEYKANRLDESGEGEEEPDLLEPQIPVLLELLDLFGIACVGADDYEADDVMATYASREKGPIRVVTGDRDLFQIADDKRDVKIVYLAKGVSQHELVDTKWIAKRYEIPGDRYALFAMFRGDPSDGLPGVKGIGEKGAALIANHATDVNHALELAEQDFEIFPPALRKKILLGRSLQQLRQLSVNCAIDAPIPAVDLALPKKPDSLSAIYLMQEKYGLGASIDRLISALGW